MIRAALASVLLVVAQAAAAQTPVMQAADAQFQARRWPAAERAYLDVVKGDSTASLAWYRLGRIYQEGLNDHARALVHFQAALRHGFTPGFLPRLGMARANVLLNKADDALTVLETMAGNGYSQPENVTGDTVLARLAAQPRFTAVLARMKGNAEPCEHLPEARQLDFWLGTWDVFAPNGVQQGVNRIEKMLRGCALMENWTGGAGREGKSLNFFDPQRKTWRQVWVADGNSVLDYRNGEYRDRAMHFSGISIAANGDTTLQKLTFKNVHADTVHQIFEQSTDRGKTWTVTWTGIYIRRSGDRATGRSERLTR